MDRIENLARRVVDARYDSLSPEEIAGAKRGIMDGIGVTLAGSTLSNKGHVLVELAEEYGGRAQSTVLGYGARLPAPWAAYANGAMVHCLDYDDYFGQAGVHPSHSCLAAALAVAELRGDVSGEEFITAFAAASDLVIRIGIAGAPQGQKEYGVFNAYATSYFGAAAVAGKLLGLDAAQMVSCLGIAFSQISSSMQILNESDSNMREIFPALSGKTGVLAAVLAQRGVQGVKDILDGKAGYLNVQLHGDFHAGVLDVKPGDPCLISQICIKPTPACGQTLIFIDLACELVKKYGIRPENVESITLKVGKFGHVLCIPEDKKKRPPLPMDAKFSVPYCVAYCIAHGKRPGLAAFMPESLRDERTLAVAAKVAVELDETLGAGAIVEPGAVTIRCRDGSVYSQEGTYQYGCAENPIRHEDVVEKFRECVSFSRKPVADVDQLVFLLENLESVSNISKIIAMVS